jgi:hypothetical protein
MRGFKSWNFKYAMTKRFSHEAAGEMPADSTGKRGWRFRAEGRDLRDAGRLETVQPRTARNFVLRDAGQEPKMSGYPAKRKTVLME